jgi:hypothetical protein
MGDSEASPQDLENQLRKLVADAKVRLDLTRNHLREVQRDLKSGALPSSERQYAYQQALRAETLALSYYQSVLKVFSTLVLDCKIPDEQDTP